MRGGALDNPTQEMYGLMNRKIALIKSDMLKVGRGNTRGRKREEPELDPNDMRQLPKRQRKR